ncbi:hypothetical protein [Ralstonia chuxiongensis]|nr:hypothetical protein [Ralstonia chuxiongensis]CAJ0782358.1 hypothetical protein R8510_04994 [Ralstonia chuxiongensis]
MAKLKLIALRFVAVLMLVPDWAWMLLTMLAVGVFVLDWQLA